MAANISQQLIRPFTKTVKAGIAPASSLVVPEGAQKATFAAGCFWGVEHSFRHEFKDKGLHDIRVGYIGGEAPNPTYRVVSAGRSGYAEAVQLSFDPSKLKYRQLLEHFYKMHDPTTLNQQGPDIGTQYRSAIFYHDSEQEREAREITKKVNKRWWRNEVKTEILPAGDWWDAEDYHQQYLIKNTNGYECKTHFRRKHFIELD